MKEIRRQYFLLTNTHFCIDMNTLVSAEDMEKNIDHLESMMKVNSSIERFENITEINLTKSAEIFIYLNSCPNVIVDWVNLFKDLFQNSSPKTILSTLNRITKVSILKNRYIQNIAENLIHKLQKVLPLTSNAIESLTKGSGVPICNMNEESKDNNICKALGRKN